MAKFCLILPAFLVASSGCGICDCQKVEAETSATAVPVVESEPIQIETVVEAANPPLIPRAVVEAPPLTKDSVRRLQRGLHQIGFDAGPVDGIPGSRTKAAYVRLQSACSRFAPLLENASLHTAEGLLTSGAAAAGKFPSRVEIQDIQRNLRQAGLDPGPIDGIFGSRTRLALRKFEGGCLMAKEFEGMLSAALPPFVPETVDSRPPDTSVSSTPKVAVGVTHSSRDPEPTALRRVQSRAEIRLLQLRLRDAGFDPGPFDGIMGPKTRAALVQYETSRGGKETKASLTSPILSADY